MYINKFIMKLLVKKSPKLAFIFRFSFYLCTNLSVVGNKKDNHLLLYCLGMIERTQKWEGHLLKWCMGNVKLVQHIKLCFIFLNYSLFLKFIDWNTFKVYCFSSLLVSILIQTKFFHFLLHLFLLLLSSTVVSLPRIKQFMLCHHQYLVQGIKKN